MEASETRPAWTKPLDSVENCVERVDSRAYAFDMDQYFAALTFLTERKDQLGFDLEFAVPQGEHYLTRTNDPAWDRIVSLTIDRCGCGQHRVIVGGNKTSALAGDDRAFVIASGQRFDLVPRGLERRQALVQLAVEERDGKALLLIHDRPYAETINFNTLFGGTPAYDLDKLGPALARQPNPAPLAIEGWTLAALRAADPAAKTVTVIPNATFDALAVEG